jgi:transcriptional regulator with XRE-family HTH domain
VIDPEALRRIRTDRGLSQRKLAAAIGVDPLTVKRVEDGADAGDLPLRVVERLVTTLGTDLQNLLRRGQPSSDTDDLFATVGATLLAHGRTTITKLATALATSSREIVSAVMALDAQLAAAGISIARHHDDLWLVPRTAPAEGTSSDRPLSIAEARLLRRIHRGEDVRRALSSIDRQFTLPALQRRGLVDGTGSGPEVSVGGCLSLSLPRNGATG